ncbi:MAG: S-layer homology domain-containing protein, partial [Alkaliphilus sp.]|nr:S-layer homology domain-containing protein [Alkaliphilus sp.]
MKRVLTFILVLSMVLGSVGMAFAGNFEDVTDKDVAQAVDRLSLLGILEGYPDGTFKPENTITRAEFAAVAVRAKGLKDAADASEGLMTGFTDVPAGHWASGYINIATKLGLVNGMGDGTYAPEAPITYEQAVTLIVRTLGYEPSAQTKGGYPYGYLIVANEIGLLDDVKGVQGAPASRGIVAQITDNALEIPKMIQVGFGTDAKYVVSGSKEHGDDAEKQLLLNDLGVDEYYGYVINSKIVSNLKENEIRFIEGKDSGKKLKVTENVDTDAVLGAGVTAWAKDDVVFSISLGFKYKVNGVKYEFNADQVIYDELTESKEDEVSLTILDDEYDWALKRDRLGVYVNNKSINVEDVKDGAWGRLVLNEYDEIIFAYLFDFEPENSGIVTNVGKDDIDYINLAADEDVLALDKAKNVYVYNNDLSRAELDDIEEETAIFYWVDKDKSKDDYYIVINDETVEGNLDAVRVSDSRVTVDGINVSKADDAIFSDDEMKDFKEWEDYESVKEYVDEGVVVYKNLADKAIALVTDAKAKSSTIYGVATWMTDARKPVLTVYTVEGKEIDYKFADTGDVPGAKPQSGVGYRVVGFKLDKDGDIAKGEFSYIDEEITFNKGDKDKFATDSIGNKYYLTKDTVILKALDSKGKVKPSVIKYDDIIKKTIDKNNEAIIKTVKDKGNDLAVVVFTKQNFDAVDTDEYALVLASPRKVGKDYKVEIDIAGEGKDDYVLEDVNVENVKKGALIKFTFNHKDEVSVDSITYSEKKIGSTVNEKEGNYLTVGGTKYRVTEDTVYYETDKNGKLDGTTRLSKIGKGDKVVILANGKGELQVVVVVTAYAGEDVGDDDDDVVGVVTYINGGTFAVNVPNTTDTFVLRVGTTTKALDENYRVDFGSTAFTQNQVYTAELLNLKTSEVVAKENFIATAESKVKLASITAVGNINVAFGTTEADAKAALAKTTKVKDENGKEYTVSLTW